MPRLIDEIDQLKSVLLFRQELERKALVWDYPGPKVFADEIRKHLCLRMERLVQGQRHTSKATPRDESINDLRALWGHMAPELQKAFSVAYNETRRAGDPGIQTRDLFAALLRVAPKQLAPLVKDIPRGALPEAVSGPIAEQPYIVEERPWVSHCVASSISRLRRVMPPGRTLTAADIFADIAKNGTGESVARLRKHKIGPKEIDQILVRNNLSVLKT